MNYQPSTSTTPEEFNRCVDCSCREPAAHHSIILFIDPCWLGKDRGQGTRSLPAQCPSEGRGGTHTKMYQDNRLTRCGYIPVNKISVVTLLLECTVSVLILSWNCQIITIWSGNDIGKNIDELKAPDIIMGSAPLYRRITPTENRQKVKNYDSKSSENLHTYECIPDWPLDGISELLKR